MRHLLPPAPRGSPHPGSPSVSFTLARYVLLHSDSWTPVQGQYPPHVHCAIEPFDSPDEGELLQPEEILVTVQTNIGWTVLFSRAAAIITDVGAPLSHTAIVARELGLPAVVGCGDATQRLKTGDRILVDGGQGLVRLLQD
jgi:phosphohistidine swiveling domain-containing protein